MTWVSINLKQHFTQAIDSSSEFCASGEFMMAAVDALRRYKCRVYLGWGWGGICPLLETACPSLDGQGHIYSLKVGIIIQPSAK